MCDDQDSQHCYQYCYLLLLVFIVRFKYSIHLLFIQSAYQVVLGVMIIISIRSSHRHFALHFSIILAHLLLDFLYLLVIDFQ